MANDIKIVPARETDLPAIRVLLVELMAAMEDTEGFDIDKAVENCRSFIRSTGQYVLVAKLRHEIAGCINFSMRKTILHPAPSGLIDELIVSEKSRGTGIGKQLIQAAVDKCRELGCCEVEVSTEKSNIKARKFYKACGFEEEAVLLELNLTD